VKLDITVNNVTRSKKFPIFSAKMGIEGLIYVIDKFKKHSANLNFDAADKWNNFDEVLDTVAESKWETQVANIAPQARNNNRFNAELDVFIQSHTGSTHPRDVLIKYIESKNCKKPVDVNPMDHKDRIEVLVNIANRLQGNVPQIDANNLKKLVFESFPTSWQENYLMSGRPEVENATMNEIIEYMNINKQKADKDIDHRAKKKLKTERIRGGGSGKNEGGKSNDKKQGCPIPGHKYHSWEDCSLNPRSKNYGQIFSRGNNRGGRGSGRGGRFQGRGGRGDYGRGRGGYHDNRNQNQNQNQNYYRNNNNSGDQNRNQNYYNNAGPMQGQYHTQNDYHHGNYNQNQHNNNDMSHNDDKNAGSSWH
jgi:hypothetical protein